MIEIDNSSFVENYSSQKKFFTKKDYLATKIFISIVALFLSTIFSITLGTLIIKYPKILPKNFKEFILKNRLLLIPLLALPIILALGLILIGNIIIYMIQYKTDKKVFSLDEKIKKYVKYNNLKDLIAQHNEDIDNVDENQRPLYTKTFNQIKNHYSRYATDSRKNPQNKNVVFSNVIEEFEEQAIKLKNSFLKLIKNHPALAVELSMISNYLEENFNHSEKPIIISKKNIISLAKKIKKMENNVIHGRIDEDSQDSQNKNIKMKNEIRLIKKHLLGVRDIEDKKIDLTLKHGHHAVFRKNNWEILANIIYQTKLSLIEDFQKENKNVKIIEEVVEEVLKEYPSEIKNDPFNKINSDIDIDFNLKEFWKKKIS
jgi:hypothetical protein